MRPLIIAAMVLFSAPVAAAAVGTSSTSHLFPITRGTTLQVEYFGNGDITVPDPAVTTVLLVVHGTNRNADDYARYALEAANLDGKAASTLVVAPRFVTSSENPAKSKLYWSSDGWKQGDLSTDSRPFRVSSFTVMDELVDKASTTFPGARIVVAGHSAGGQFVNRYAAGTQSAVPRRYVSANPSSYLYLNTKRWKNGTLRILTSSEVRSCSGYNDYKYGLQDLNTFMGSAGDLKTRYLNADMTYLLGEKDTNPNDSSLDTSCEAKWQGAHRFQRGTQYHAYLVQEFGSRHKKVTVPGVAHDPRGMFTSAAGRSVLFG